MKGPSPQRGYAPLQARLLLFYLAVLSPWLRLGSVQTAIEVGAPFSSWPLEVLLWPPLHAQLLPFGVFALLCLGAVVVVPDLARHLLIRAGLYVGMGISMVHLLAWEAARQGGLDGDAPAWLLWACLQVVALTAPVYVLVLGVGALWRRLPEDGRRKGLTALLFTVGVILLFVPAARYAMMSVLTEGGFALYTRLTPAVTSASWLGFVLMAHHRAHSRPRISAAARSPDSSAPSI